MSAPSAFAGLMSVSQDGLDVTVSWTTVGQNLNFTYVADFTNANANWIGATMDSLSVQLGSASNGVLINSFSANATSTAAGTWVGFRDKVSGNGCSVGSADAICYTVLPSGIGGDGAEVIAAKSYSWFFTVGLNAGFDPDTVMQGSHSIKFLALKYNPNNQKWSTAGQLSQSATVPEPGTLTLLGVGLLGLAMMRRKRR